MNASPTPHPLAQRFMDALKRLERDGESGLDDMLALFAENATVFNSALDLRGEERSGRDGVRAFWSDYVGSLRGASTEFHTVTEASAAVGLFWTTQARGPAGSGAEPVRYEGATLLRLDSDGERIETLRGYYDTRALTPPAPG